VNKILILAVSGVFWLSSSCAADSLTGVALDEVITLSPGGVELRLKGSAIKSNARQAVYIGGLYLQKDASSVADIIESSGAKRFIIKTSKSIKPATIIRAINLGISVNSSEEDLIKLEPLVEAFNQLWRSEIKEGDEICIDYKPELGTLVSINGVKKGTIPGKLFYKAFLKTWLGDKPLNAAIKRQLLGYK